MIELSVPERDKTFFCDLSIADHVVQSGCSFLQIAFFEATGRSCKLP